MNDRAPPVIGSITFDPSKPWHPAPRPDVPGRRAAIQLATDAQLDAIAADYAATMRARGFVIGVPEETAIRRSAAIQDAWRVAFARGLK